MGILIGSMTLEDPVILARMSGVSDLPFRRLVKRLGAGLVVSEMIASEAMIRETRQSMTMARSCADEQPMAVQLAGCEPRIMAEAAKLNADRALQESGADGLMIGRGCYGRPWFVRQVIEWLKRRRQIPDPPLEAQLEIVLGHYEEMLVHYGTEVGSRIARKHVAWYSKGLPGSAEFRGAVNETVDIARVRRLLRSFYEPRVARNPA